MADKIDQEFVNQTWDDLSFYEDHLSLFMKKQLDLVDRNEMWYNIFHNVLKTGESLFDRFDIFYYESSEKNYFTKNDVDPDRTSDAILDLVGQIYGARRQLILSVDDVLQQVTLTNYEFLVYIQAMIARSTFDGTNEDLLRIYTGSPVINYQAGINYRSWGDYTFLEYCNSYLTQLGIIYVPGTYPLTATLYMTCKNRHINGSAGGYTDNIIALFLGGYLTIESLGIVYDHKIGAIFKFGKYMSDDKQTGEGYFDYYEDQVSGERTIYQYDAEGRE